MAVNPPRHVIPPPSTEKIRRAKVDLELVRARPPSRPIAAYTHVVLDARHVDADERVRQAASICARRRARWCRLGTRIRTRPRAPGVTRESADDG
jgi:hypothetical protein